jgi:hypothetical protein
MVRLAETRGVTVMEIRRLGQTEPSPPGRAWVLIEKRGDCYFVRGRAKIASIEASLGPTATHSAAVAIWGAEAWADLLMADVVYVRDDV